MTADDKVAAFELLMGEVSGAIADLVAGIQAREEAGTVDEMRGALVDIAATLEQWREQPLDKLVEAIKGLRVEAPAVNVTVLPAKVQIIQSDTKGATWEVTIPDRYGREDRVMTIKRTK